MKKYTVLFMFLFVVGLGCLAQAAEKIPVIYDSDIGDDIDDTWALGLLLASPEFDIKLVVGDQGKAEYRAKLFAKFLERAGRTDIPIGFAFPVNIDGGGNQSDWVKDYDLSAYPGKIHQDGVQAIIDTIMQSPTPITVLAVGPLPNIAEALKREPKIAQKARFVGMHGSVRLGYGGSSKVSAEYNVRANAKACQIALRAPWDITITPLDTCGLIVLKGERYQKVRNSTNPIAKAIMENYVVWCKANLKNNPNQWKTQSSTLFDTVAVYLAMADEYLKMETLGIAVTDDGYTKIDDKAKKMKVATAWKNRTAFEEYLVQRITQSN
jgi:inosine-uridine nucleoside N-ribohydrolase